MVPTHHTSVSVDLQEILAVDKRLELVVKLFCVGVGTSKKSRTTSANGNTLKLTCELLRLFITGLFILKEKRFFAHNLFNLDINLSLDAEAVQRAAAVAEAEGASEIEPTHLEIILPQHIDGKPIQPASALNIRYRLSGVQNWYARNERVQECGAEVGCKSDVGMQVQGLQSTSKAKDEMVVECKGTPMASQFLSPFAWLFPQRYTECFRMQYL
ncbi:hypothetical protein V8G54_017052 [Vigna mungo]|uniref:Uncharacterized protein n=1 Tax=Vigna mungo TaxID=3915 RepID=A0AAQ3NNS9_VIGMU